MQVTTLWSYTGLFGHTLTPSTAFTALQLLAVLQGPLQQCTFLYKNEFDMWPEGIRQQCSSIENEDSSIEG